MAGGVAGVCPKCRNQALLLPLHGENGGPVMCMKCGTDWHVEHGRRRKAGRLVVKALKAYEAAGGSLWRDLDKLRLAASGMTVAAGYEADTLGAELGDVTKELLDDVLQLTHPDKHPPERRDLANRVTQELVALKPFVFPAPKTPESPEAPKPPRDTSTKSRPDRLSEASRKLTEYPCELCADEIPRNYCNACRAEWERRETERLDQRRAKQREYYANRKRRQDQLWELHNGKPKCATCGDEFEAKRKDAKYCSAACRQKAYRNGSTKKSEDSLDNRYGAAEIRSVIEATFNADSDNAYLTTDLCAQVYGARRQYTKAQRLAVIRAAKEIVAEWPLWDVWRGDGQGRQYVFFNADSLRSYAMARLKSDWLYARYDEARLRKRLELDGQDYDYIKQGGAWWRHWKMYRAELKGETDTAEYQDLKAQQKAVAASYGI